MCLFGHLSAVSPTDIRCKNPLFFCNSLISLLVATQQYKTEVALVKVRQIYVPYKPAPVHPKWLLLASKLKDTNISLLG